ncbi:MAG: G1 family endopeptidase [Candidatus Bathyarchaeota archaeon]|nr:G1 family endopeptidase [Candidatus Bathyarchaeota archaeon]
MLSITKNFLHQRLGLAKKYKIITLAAALFLIIIGAGIYYIIQSSLPPSVLDTRNWAGYVVATNLQNPQPEIVEVTGSWIVPAVEDIGTDAFSAVWIGIGGKFDTTLIQTGTEQDSVGGFATYNAWFEMLPSDSITIRSLNISPGDRIEATIRLVDSSTNRWLIMLADLTTGQSYQQNFTYGSSQLSAEWIVERPKIDSTLSPLANFGNITFSNCQVTVGAKAGSIDEFPNSKIIMDAQATNQPTQLVDVSSLGSQGNEFTVTYLAP